MERRATLIRRGTPFKGGDGNDVFIPEAAKAGMKYIGGELRPRSLDDVTKWLQDLNLGEYADAFRSNGVSYDLLVSLNNAELRHLGVHRLAHRRKILDAVGYLISTSTGMKTQTLAEDGRILSHLSNMRNYLSWTRFSIFILTLNVLLLRSPLVGVTNRGLVKGTSLTMTFFGLATHWYGTHRYWRLIRDIENPGEHYSPDSHWVLLPSLLVISTTTFVLFLTLYGGAASGSVGGAASGSIGGAAIPSTVVHLSLAGLLAI